MLQAIHADKPGSVSVRLVNPHVIVRVISRGKRETIPVY